jgi:hypothetical protein
MANPNIVNVSTITGTTAYISPATTGAIATWTYADPSTSGSVSLPGLTPASGTVNKINNIVVANTTASAVNVSVAISNNPTFASGTPYYIVSTISVPAYASLIVVDKTTAIYVTQYQSIGVTAGTGSGALTIVASFEAISA